jgi:hypothetical protein
MQAYGIDRVTQPKFHAKPENAENEKLPRKALEYDRPLLHFKHNAVGSRPGPSISLAKSSSST